MPGIKDLLNVWKNLKEVDLRPYRKAATTPVKLAITGRPGVGRRTLADQLRRDPQKPESQTQPLAFISDLVPGEWESAAELIILMLDPAWSDFSLEQTMARRWLAGGKSVLAFFNDFSRPENPPPVVNPLGWDIEHVVRGSALDPIYLQNELVPVVLELLPERHLALARQFPLFRSAVAHQLIKDTCFANAVYSFGTGVAEVVPIIDIPFDVTDMVVLTKSQGFLVYKLGLALGFSTRWQDYAGEFGSVIGSGFIWRQLARLLIGLIPIWGIVPKVAVAYSGTFVVGNVFLQWYLTGRRVSKQQMQAIYQQAALNGKNFATNAVSLLKRPRRQKPAQLAAANSQPCKFCGKPNAPDAHFCQYCGQTL